MIWNATRVMAITLVLMVVVAGCVRAPSGGLVTPGPTATETEGALVDPSVPATAPVTGTVRTGTPGAGATRLPRATPTPIVLKAQSAEATLGKAYTYQLSTRCGVDFIVDFDGSFWDSAGARPASLGNPTQKGTMTLVDSRHAKFSYDKGAISYTRHAGVKAVPYLC